LVEEAPYQEQRPQEADSSHVEANSSYGQTTQPRRLCKFGPSCTRAQCYFYHPEREVYGFGMFLKNLLFVERKKRFYFIYFFFCFLFFYF